ncbi:MAG: FAD-dependent oxidoreductase, partial [Anaerolineae bacterium]|nr:FAD-dependent oxidoreductase [Anaerolineae bacterium]
MNRRRALQLMGTMVMGLLVQAHAAAAREGMAMLQTKKIVVIGAGLSGLAAARELQAQGHEVVVVEARDRIGGRIWTSTKWADMPLDLGATWIHGVEDNPITELAQTLQAERLTTSYNRNATFDMTGEALSSADESYLEELREQVMEELRKAQQRNADASIRDVIDALAARIEASPKALRF